MKGGNSMTLYVLYKNNEIIKTSFKLMELLNMIKEIRKTDKNNIYEVGKIKN